MWCRVVWCRVVLWQTAGRITGGLKSSEYEITHFNYKRKYYRHDNYYRKRLPVGEQWYLFAGSWWVDAVVV
jgi:hypothetical protein